MSKKDEKTNVMRILDQKKIPYKSYNYLQTGAVNGMEVAQALGEDPGMVFKTLVTVGKSKTNYVFVVPVNKELNLKRAAHSVGEKSIEMIKQKELLPLTGYIHFPHRDEETVCHYHRPERGRIRQDHLQCGEDRFSGGSKPGGSEKGDPVRAG